jgi:hypothetical protein
LSVTAVRSKRAVAVAVAATLVGVSAVVLLTGQHTSARAAAAPGSTVRASVADGPAGEAGSGEDQELSSDGTAVAFTSYARLDALSTGDNQAVYVRDLRRGRTVMVSRGQFDRPEPPPSSTPPPPTTTTTTTTTTEPTFTPPRLAGEPLLALNGRRAQPTEPPLEFGEVAPNGDSSEPTISADGRYVAFISQADNILPEDDDTDRDLLVCDRDPDGDGEFDEEREGGGLDYTYFRVNEPQWNQGDGYVFRTDFPSRPKLSDDASRIVWEDEYTPPEGQYRHVVRTAALRPATGGAVGDPGAVEIVDTVLDDHYQPTWQQQPDVSGDGRFVVLVADYVRSEGGGEFPTYVPFHAVVRKDTVTGAVTRVDWDEATTAAKPVPLSVDRSVHLAAPAISADGGVVAFEAEEYEDRCSDGCWGSVAQQPVVYVVRVREDGTPVDSVVASRDNAGAVVNGFSPALSGNGRFVAFGTDNFDVHDGVDVQRGENQDSCITYSPGLTGAPMVNMAGLPPASDARERRTVCQTVVRDLVVDRTRLANDAARLPGTLVSAGTGADCAETVPDGGTCAGNGDSAPYYPSAPSLSHNGSTVAFDSDATNLVPDLPDGNERTDVFVRTLRPELRADPSPLEFGEVQLGESSDRVVRFGHVGTGPLVVTEVVVEGSDEFAVGAQTCSGEAVVLQQTDACEVSVGFTPDTAGERTGTLRVRLRDGREFTVPLLGKGTEEEVPPEPGAARFAAGPDPLDFGDRLLLSAGPTQTVTVTNEGESPLTVTGVTVVSAVAQKDYTVASDTCTDTPVPAAGTCAVTVAFSPQAPGARPAVLRFVDDTSGGEAHLIGLAGTGSKPDIIVNPAVSQPGRVITVTGTGFSPTRPVTITMTGLVETTTVQPDATGKFTRALLILPKSAIGNRPVVATIDGTTPAIAAQRPVLIVTPSVGPADFVIRN